MNPSVEKLISCRTIKEHQPIIGTWSKASKKDCLRKWGYIVKRTSTYVYVYFFAYDTEIAMPIDNNLFFIAEKTLDDYTKEHPDTVKHILTNLLNTTLDISNFLSSPSFDYDDDAVTLRHVVMTYFLTNGNREIIGIKTDLPAPFRSPTHSVMVVKYHNTDTYELVYLRDDIAEDLIADARVYLELL